MVETEEEAVFPVVLYDGEREMNVGDARIHSRLDFKQFQLMLTHMIGISYNNLTTYLVDSKKPKLSPERRKILITGKVNFSVLVRERNCYFLVVLKRSRRERRRKPNRQSVVGLELSPPQSVSPDDLLLLRRNQLGLIDQQIPGYGSYYYDDRFQDLRIQRENYLNMVLNRNPNYGYESALNVNFPRIEESYPAVQKRRNRAACKECTKAEQEGTAAPFHLCVNDEVIVGVFRSPVGPICRRQ